MSIPLDSFFISQCFCNGLPQHDSGILDRVVAVYLQISGNFDSQIKKSMSCKAGKHMVKETDASRNVSLSCSVQIQCHLDLCLFCHTTAGCNSALHLLVLLFKTYMDRIGMRSQLFRFCKAFDILMYLLQCFS